MSDHDPRTRFVALLLGGARHEEKSQLSPDEQSDVLDPRAHGSPLTPTV